MCPVLFIPRLSDVVIPAGGPDKYLEQKYPTKDVGVSRVFRLVSPVQDLTAWQKPDN